MSVGACIFITDNCIRLRGGRFEKEGLPLTNVPKGVQPFKLQRTKKLIQICDIICQLLLRTIKTVKRTGNKTLEE